MAAVTLCILIEVRTAHVQYMFLIESVAIIYGHKHSFGFELSPYSDFLLRKKQDGHEYAVFIPAKVFWSSTCSGT